MAASAGDGRHAAQRIGGQRIGGQRIGGQRIGALGAALLGVALLGACAEGLSPDRAADDVLEGSAGAPENGGDVEAPEVFQVTGEGLWDGRPSLGGVWVAHPDVAEPERVIVRNQDNGESVVGALFRRERESPGPAIQVSSDAAEALGMLGGAPAALEVTALRREAPPADDAMPADEAAPELPEIEAASADFDPAGLPPPDPAAAAMAAETAAILAAGAVAPEAPPDLAGPAAGLGHTFVDLGVFAVEANAVAAADALAAEGLAARVSASTAQGEAVWRVLVGPAATEAEGAGLLDRVRAEGFDGAFLAPS